MTGAVTLLTGRVTVDVTFSARGRDRTVDPAVLKLGQVRNEHQGGRAVCGEPPHLFDRRLDLPRAGSRDHDLAGRERR